MKFTKLGLDPRIAHILEVDYQFKQPTEVQKSAIPQIIKKKQVIGISPSGTGKTVAFLTPLIHNIINEKVDHESPIGLIVTPTRELARQIHKLAVDIGRDVVLTTSLVISHRKDTKIERDFKDSPVDLIVATPIKLIESIKSGLVDISKIAHFVLDESDRMLELGFYDEIMEILSHFRVNENLKIHMFSATFSTPLEKLAKNILVKPTIVEVAKHKTSNKLVTEVYEVLSEDKQALLIQILKSGSIFKVIVFVRTQEAARITYRALADEGFNVDEIHGGLTNIQRITALENFAEDEVDILVASDLIARGIDIEELSHVINFDIPKDIDDYIHRVGRTARAGKSGTAINLVSPNEIHIIEKYQKELKTTFKVMKKLPDELRKSDFAKLKEEEVKVQTEQRFPRKRSAAPMHNKKKSFNKGWDHKVDKSQSTSKRPSGGRKSFGDKKSDTPRSKFQKPKRGASKSRTSRDKYS
jgi:ATP-dependent RNA helicase RhlE